jgi:hypothetical protein
MGERILSDNLGARGAAINEADCYPEVFSDGI